MMSAFASRGNELVLDLRHSSVVDGVDAPAQGWIDRLEKRGDGEARELWAHVALNESGHAYVAKDQYRYISPVICFNDTDPATGKTLSATLHSVAMTNTPFIPGMAPIQLAASRGGAARSRKAFAKETTMTPDDALALVNTLCDQLGISDPTELPGAIAELISDESTEPDAPKSMAAARRVIAANTSAIAIAIRDRDAAATERDTLRAEQLTRRIDDDVAKGRILPGEKEMFLDLARKDIGLYEKMTKDRRAVPMGRVAGPAEKQGKAGSTGAMEAGDSEPQNELERTLVMSLKAAGASPATIKKTLAKRRESSVEV